MPQLTEMPVPEFSSLADAGEWMDELVDDPCVDNYRFAFTDDSEAVGKYKRLESEGCCGFFDRKVKIAGREAFIGCNYGH